MEDHTNLVDFFKEAAERIEGHLTDMPSTMEQLKTLTVICGEYCKYLCIGVTVLIFKGYFLHVGDHHLKPGQLSILRHLLSHLTDLMPSYDASNVEYMSEYSSLWKYFVAHVKDVLAEVYVYLSNNVLILNLNITLDAL